MCRPSAFDQSPEETAYSFISFGGKLRKRADDTEHTHGTGCVLSSAIACFLAKGESVPDSVAMAKRFVGEALLKGKAHPVREHYGPLGLF